MIRVFRYTDIVEYCLRMAAQPKHAKRTSKYRRVVQPMRAITNQRSKACWCAVVK